MRPLHGSTRGDDDDADEDDNNDESHKSDIIEYLEEDSDEEEDNGYSRKTGIISRVPSMDHPVERFTSSEFHLIIFCFDQHQHQQF